LFYLHYDPEYGENGEIIPMSVDPEHLIIDKNAIAGGNPEFVCHVLKMSVEKLLSLWPEREKEILKACGIQRKGPKNMSQEVAVRS
jgi:hypothetical protein